MKLTKKLEAEIIRTARMIEKEINVDTSDDKTLDLCTEHMLPLVKGLYSKDLYAIIKKYPTKKYYKTKNDTMRNILNITFMHSAWAGELIMN